MKTIKQIAFATKWVKLDFLKARRMKKLNKFSDIASSYLSLIIIAFTLGHVRSNFEGY